MSLVRVRAPFRVSFFGGGSDYPEWLKNEPGAVLSAAINKYTYIACRYLPRILGVKYRILSGSVELSNSIPHPVIRQALLSLDFDDILGLELYYQSDLPTRSGIGSSSSFVVAVLHALSCLRGRELGKRAMAEMAIDLEQNYMDNSAGSQDQVAAAYGGLNIIRFGTDGTFDVSRVSLAAERECELIRRLMLFHPGRARIGCNVAASVAKNVNNRAVNIRKMVAMVDEGAGVLRTGNLDDFGRLLHEAWVQKRALSDRVSSQHIDDLYDRARRAGALGGKLLGAGETGFVLFYVPPDAQAAVRAALAPECYQVLFAIDHQGSRII
jgi:D-glycero-alpha-D-manno-heptose-7-phosphate kinase